MDIPIIEKDGKKIFIGQDDTHNPPVFIKNPTKRFCNSCHKESDNDVSVCPCGVPFDDGKMQCPVCKRFFEYLVGEDINGGKMGCETCWKPPVKQERRPNEVTTKPVFD